MGAFVRLLSRSAVLHLWRVRATETLTFSALHYMYLIGAPLFFSQGGMHNGKARAVLPLEPDPQQTF